jgi:hypothetical protein
MEESGKNHNILRCTEKCRESEEKGEITCNMEGERSQKLFFEGNGICAEFSGRKKVPAE